VFFSHLEILYSSSLKVSKLHNEFNVEALVLCHVQVVLWNCVSLAADWTELSTWQRITCTCNVDCLYIL